MLDLVIRNGTIIDGTGGSGFSGDLGVSQGRIAAIGAVADSGRTEIDAAGKVVCPGFVDPHTHYDAQLFWDPAASPSNLHGVTTVIGGNCGFTLAPLNPGDAPYLQRMMAKVEGMPLSALESGLDWSWQTFADYLARLDGNLGVNAGFLVGHCAIRRAVMGADATGNEADPGQLEAMKSLLADAIAAGGLGFSTSLSYTHNDGDGAPVASRFASSEEVVALCSVVAEHEGTTLEYVTDGCMQGFTDDELDLMVAMSRAARRPLNWNVLTIDSADPDRYRAQLGASVRAADHGARVVALTMPVLVGMNMSFLNYCALNMLPDWGEVLGLPVPERMARLADPQTRAHLAERASSPDAGVFSRLTGWGGYRIGDTFSSANDGLGGRTVAEIAAERGCRVLRHPGGRGAGRRTANRFVAGAHRRRRRELAAPGRGLAERAHPFGRLRRRRPPRPDVRRPLYHRLFGRLPAGPAAGLAGDGDPHAHRCPGPAVRPARAGPHRAGVARRSGGVQPRHNRLRRHADDGRPPGRLGAPVCRRGGGGPRAGERPAHCERRPGDR